MEINPLKQINVWLDEQIRASKAKIPTACCLSTQGTDGFPNSRFVSLKGIEQENFVITGPITSRKGVEIARNKKVGLSFWWPETERQVRVQGIASPLPSEMADTYFEERSRESQLVSIISEQGKQLADHDALKERYNQLISTTTEKRFKRPNGWNGYLIKPVRIELMEFSTNRFHKRTLFELVREEWKSIQLQP